jgi:hypothetical protein
MMVATVALPNIVRKFGERHLARLIRQSAAERLASVV